MGFWGWISDRMRVEEQVEQFACNESGSAMFIRVAIERLMASDYEWLNLAATDDGGRIQIGRPTEDDPTTLGINLCNYGYLDAPDTMMQRFEIPVPAELTLEDWDVESFALYRAPTTSVNAAAMFVHRMFVSFYGCGRSYGLSAWLESAASAPPKSASEPVGAGSSSNANSSQP